MWLACLQPWEADLRASVLPAEVSQKLQNREWWSGWFCGAAHGSVCHCQLAGLQDSVLRTALLQGVSRFTAVRRGLKPIKEIRQDERDCKGEKQHLQWIYSAFIQC